MSASNYSEDLDPDYPKFVARCSCEWSASDFGEERREAVLAVAKGHERQDRHDCGVTVLRVAEDGSEEVIR